MKIKQLLLASLALSMSASTFAQNKSGGNVVADDSKLEFPTYKTWSVGVNGGLLNSLADIKKNDFLPSTSNPSELGGMFGIDIAKYWNPVFGLQARLAFGQTAGVSEKAPLPVFNNPVSFTADVQEYSLNAIINFSNIGSVFSFRPSTKQRHVLIYGIIGAGGVTFATKLKDQSTGASLPVKNSSKTTGVFNTGLGVKFRLSPTWDLGVETILANLNNDDFDGVTLGRINDSYNYTNLNLSYKIGKGEEHVIWVNPMDPFFNDYNNARKKIGDITNDQDKDGVADMFDKDNTTPEGTKVYGDGTTVDTDGDGIADAKDADPFSPKGAKVDNNGVEIDSDADGVGDSQDLEPNTPMGNMVNFQGKTIKADGTNGSVYFPSVYFDTNSSRIKSRYDENIAGMARVLKANPSLKISVIGNADSRGSESLNNKLSEQRARAVADNLVKVYNIDGSRITVKYNGEKAPLADGKLSINRRVDFEASK